jgi:hypothetical protein
VAVEMKPDVSISGIETDGALKRSVRVDYPLGQNMSMTFMRSIAAFHEVIGVIQSGSSVSIYRSTKTGLDSPPPVLGRYDVDGVTVIDCPSNGIAVNEPISVSTTTNTISWIRLI